jgi:hypothetical protein
MVEFGHPILYNDHCTNQQYKSSFAPKLDLWEASPTPMWVNFGIG